MTNKNTPQDEGFRLPDNIETIADTMQDIIKEHFHDKKLLLPPYIIAASLSPELMGASLFLKDAHPQTCINFAKQLCHFSDKLLKEALDELEAMEHPQ